MEIKSKVFILVAFASILEYVSSRLISTELNFNITSYVPKFEELTLSPGKTTVYFEMQINPPSMKFPINYYIEIAVAYNTKIQNDLEFYRNWNYTEEEIQSYLYNANSAQYWSSYQTIYSGSQRIFKYSRLIANSVYKVRYKISVIDNKKVAYNSTYSVPKLIYTRKLELSSLDVNLYVKGTGRNNHDNAIVKLGEKTIFKHGKYMGLALIVLNRNNLKVEKIQTYNTFLKGNPKTITTTVIDYISGTDGSLTTVQVEKQITQLNERGYADDLYNDLKSINETSIIILTSNYGWERYISNEVIDLLGTFGAIGIKEFKNIDEEEYKHPQFKFWKNQDLIKKRPYYHPYAFVGVLNLPSGMGYESLRNNKANFYTTKNIPQAELLVRLRYYPYHKNYFFDDKKLGGHKLEYSDSYKLTWNSTDFSLLNLMPLLHYSNQTLGYNLGFTIYNHNINVDEIMNKTSNNLDTPYTTYYDRLVLGSGIASMRYTYLGSKYQSGLAFSDLLYYNFFNSIMVDEKTCKPPYDYTTSTTECPDLATFNQSIPILTCKLGIAPHVCGSNVNNVTNIFDGYS